MLFSKPINDITYKDVKDFISKKPKESSTLDYKETFPKKLAKTICAFANTYGGIVIIGVKEDDDGYPDPKSIGIDFEKGLEERVTQISISNIYPPIVPEIQVAENKRHAFVIIRISQNKEAPYSVNHKYPYVRTGNISSPEDLATLEKLELLRRDREKMSFLRKRILDEIKLRCVNHERMFNLEIPFGIVTMEIGPLYPSQQLVEPKSLFQIIERTALYNRGDQFPINHSQDNNE